jgi:hypothetical protein
VSNSGYYVRGSNDSDRPSNMADVVKCRGLRRFERNRKGKDRNNFDTEKAACKKNTIWGYNIRINVQKTKAGSRTEGAASESCPGSQSGAKGFQLPALH